MASIQRFRVKGHSYWRIVESRRVNGKPGIRVLAYLGKANDLLARLRATESFSIRSLSHGAVAALSSLARELDVAGTIDRHLEVSGRRSRRRRPPGTRLPPLRNDGLSVGQSLLLASLGRACHATSKRGFATWARHTTLGELFAVDVERLTSQHFWDQMEQLPVDSIAPIEREIVGRVVERCGVPLETLLYDATNFFTFIASTNQSPELPARGHNKQKRHDLRQVGVALLCTRQEGIPLWHEVYGGQVPDAKSFAEALTAFRRRLVEMGQALKSLTLVYDKGNVSRVNQSLVDTSNLHYVASLSAASQKSLLAEANPKMQPVTLDQGEEVLAYRTRRTIWGAERTAVVLLSERLREGQRRGILQHVASAQRWLSRLDDTLKRGKQRRDRTRIQHDIDARLRGRQHLRSVLKVDLSRDSKKRLALSYTFDEAALAALNNDALGRVVLITDRDDWNTADIIRAYRGQADVEAVFAHLKDPVHIALRPQFHWTDQKLHVHVLTCILGYLLARLLHLRARKTIAYPHGMERLLEDLETVRRATVVHLSSRKGRPRVTTQLEQHGPDLAAFLASMGVTA
ncbi:MAG TPA: IS1634 family transposase [Vicinamibacteria bacterium]|nr:IS1634 family transposase [Vicinamibacteria bacterium]